MSIAVTMGAVRVAPNIYAKLGLIVGVVMPLLSAAIYPVYMHQMLPSWAEWTRLMELPFVACELAAIHVAVGRGYRDADLWNSLPRDVVAALILLFVGLTVSSVFTSRNVPASLALSLTTIVHLRFAAAMFFLVKAEPVRHLDSFFHYLGIGLFALTILTACKFLLPPPAAAVPGGRIEWASALPGFISVRHFGSWTGAIAAAPMIALLYGRNEAPRATSLLYLLAAGLTCWSGTRAAVLALAVVFLITALSLRRLPDLRALAQVGALSTLALFGALVLAPDSSEFALYVHDDITSADAFAAGRLELWHATFYRWLDARWFGWGSGSTFWEVNIGWSHTQPHNTILLFLISWGIVGATGALWLLCRAIVATHRIAMTDQALRPVSAMVYSLLFMSLLEGMLYYPRFIMAVMIGFAILFAARARDSTGGYCRSKANKSPYNSGRALSSEA